MPKELVLILLCLAVLLGGSPVRDAGAADASLYRRTLESLNMPDVVLVNQKGEKVRFKNLVESGKPVIVDFVYATCTTICPILSVGFTNLQRTLGKESSKIQLISITIDPENDTPRILTEYLERYQARPGWDFLTGSRADINKVMSGFGAFFPNKMAHRPFNFILTREKGKWVKLDGIIGGRDLLNELEKVGIK
ncbi:MAG: SCO family protein [Desulfobulbaceae bacterium]|nr:SCO family protein [Desulfobulbaceae bacterium]